MKRKPTKVLESNYVIKINGIAVYGHGLDTLSKARKQVKSLVLTETVQEVAIVRQTVTETVMDTFKPVVQRVLTSDCLSLDIGDDNHE